MAALKSVIRQQRRVGRAASIALALTAASASGARAQRPAVLSEAPLTGQRVEFHALMTPDTVYVGQQANYQVGVFLSDEVRARLRRNPEFVPPEMSGVLGYDLPVTHALLPDRSAGRYEAHVFERAVFPLTAGVHDVPPARLSYSLPLTRSFFSREEGFVLRTERTSVVAIALPSAGRPADFDGAVGGELRLDVRADTGARLRVGDPVLVTARVRGRGNVNLFPRPRLEVGWGIAVAGSERVALDTTGRVIAGTKEFDWLVTPSQDGRQRLPSLRYPYFDPDRGSYLVATSQPETLSVAAGTLARLDDSAAAVVRRLPLRERLGDPTPPGPSNSPVYWLALAALPLPALALGARRRTPRRRAQPSAAERLTLMADGRHPLAGQSPASRVRELRTLLVRAIADRLDLPILPGGRAGTLTRTLRLEGVSDEVAAQAEALLHELDRYAFSIDDGDDWQLEAAQATSLTGRAATVVAAVDAEARERRGMTRSGHGGSVVRLPRPAGRTVGVLIGLLLAAGATAATAGPPAAPHTPEAAFAAGVRLYHEGRFAPARAAFASAAAALPRSPDAWANLGTAAWAADDSATAALGWQRALRLDPTADDLRDHVAMLPGQQLGGAAAVPRLPPAVAEWMALIAWAAGWMLALAAARGGRPLLSPGALAALVASLLLGAGATLQNERLAAHDLSVVAGSGPLRTQPALTSSVARDLASGELVRVRARTGVWSRVQVGDQSGWVESQRLRALRLD